MGITSLKTKDLPDLYLIDKLEIIEPKEVGREENFDISCRRPYNQPDTILYDQETHGKINLYLRNIKTDEMIKLDCNYKLPDDEFMVVDIACEALSLVKKRNRFVGKFMNSFRSTRYACEQSTKGKISRKVFYGK